MSDESAFLAAIIAQPDDDTARLAFADWLDEHDDPDRAEFIRLQIRESHTEDQAERAELYDRTRSLFVKNKAKWLRDLPPGVAKRVSLDHFERGFLKKLHLVSAAAVTKISKRAWAEHPIQELRLTDTGGKLDRVLAIPSLSRLCYLSVYDGTLTESDLSALATCPHLTGVRTLWLVSAAGNPLCAALARCPSLRELNELTLEDNNIDDVGIANLTANGSAVLSRLKQLVVNSKRIGSGTGEALARAPALAALELLSVGAPNSGAIGDTGVAALAKSPHLSNLRELQLSHQNIGPKGARALAQTRHLTKLRSLYLAHNPLTAAGARAVANGPWTELTELNLWCCELGDEGAKAVAEGKCLAKVTQLSLEWNNITATGVAALCESDQLSELTALDLSDNPIGDAGARALCKSKKLKKLARVGLQLPDDFAEATVRTLKKRFGEDADFSSIC